jgi:hypothetical protein
MRPSGRIESAHVARVEYDADGLVAVELAGVCRWTVGGLLHQHIGFAKGAHGLGRLDATAYEFIERHEKPLGDGADDGRPHAVIQCSNSIGEGVPHQGIQAHGGLQGECALRRRQRG